jgi:hypothetical protein
MGIKQFLALSFSNTLGEIFSGSTLDYISNMDMFSTPPPIPISIYPALIFEAIIEQASNPLEQSLLMAAQLVVSGNPA